MKVELQHSPKNISRRPAASRPSRPQGRTSRFLRCGHCRRRWKGLPRATSERSNALGAAVSWFPSWRSWRRQLEPERKRAIELNSEIKLDSPIKSECRAALLFATGSREHLQELQEIAKA